MKLIIAFVKPYRLDNVRDAMASFGVNSFSFSEARGIGHHKGHTDIYRGVEYSPSYVPMIQITVAMRQEVVDDVVLAMRDAAKTEDPGNGKIFVCDLAQVMDISSGATGPDAILHREHSD